MKKRWMAAAGLLALCLMLGGCAAKRETAEASIPFVPAETKTTWKEPLAKLLESVYFLEEDGDLKAIYDAASDPDNPRIPDFYGCGLMDLTRDGVPELLVWIVGSTGSAGNAAFFTYDIKTGKYLGEMTGGTNQFLCDYADTETGEIRPVNRYWTRSGYGLRFYHEEPIGKGPGPDGCFNEIYLDASYEIELNDKTETYTGAAYRLRGESVTFDEFNGEYERFLRTNAMIPGTEFLLFGWDDLSEGTDGLPARCRALAEMLVSSDQQFVDYGKLQKQLK